MVTNTHILCPHLGHPEVSIPIHRCNLALRAHAPPGFAASHQYPTWGAPYPYYIVQQATPQPVQNDGDSEAAKPDKFTGKDLRKLRSFISSCLMYFDNKPFKFKNDCRQVSYAALFLSEITLLWWQPHLMAVRVHPRLRPAVPIFVRPFPSSSSRPHLRLTGPPTSSGPSGWTHQTLLASVLFSSCTLVCSLSITGRPSTCYLHPPSVYVSIPGP